MNPLELLLPVIVVLLGTGWWLSWLATRLDRAHSRAERSWAVLDAALVRRAQRALEVSVSPEVDPALMLLVCDAAAAALEAESWETRESAESVLSRILSLTRLRGVAAEQDRVALARRLHNDAVVTARSLRQRKIVRLAHLAGHAQEPQPFEMVDGDRCAPVLSRRSTGVRSD